MKIAVYAICKNEEKFIDRWLTNLDEADRIYVLDTGSTDESVKKLKEKGVIVNTKTYDFFRFDEARNDALSYIDEDIDILVSLDLDEVISKNWRKKILDAWKENTTRLRYTYNWKLDGTKPLVSFYADKIHKRKGYKWINPVHEVLVSDDEVFNNAYDIVINHYPDYSKSRSNYLELLELSVKENPFDDRSMHYLGREYMYHEKYNECIDTLIKHLNLKSSTWKDERCASMRFIARCYKELKRFNEANMWLEKAISEAPYLKDPYVEMMMLKYLQEDYDEVIKNGLIAITITNPKTYITEEFSNDETVYDLLSIAYFFKNNIKESLKYINKALEINPYNERILKNKEMIEGAYEL